VTPVADSPQLHDVQPKKKRKACRKAAFAAKLVGCVSLLRLHKYNGWPFVSAIFLGPVWQYHVNIGLTMMSRSSLVSVESKSKDPEDAPHSPISDIEKAAPESIPPPPESEKTKNSSHDSFLARFEPHDPQDPYNWPLSKKIWLTAQLGILAFVASLASAITAPAQSAIEGYTHVGSTTVVLTISLYILGFVFGPSLWGPASEVWGRKWSLIPAMVGLGLFSIGTGASKNFASIAVCRFFSGFFGSGPVSNVSAALGDVYRPKARGIAVSFYAVIVVGGPLLGPGTLPHSNSERNLTQLVIGSAIVVNKHMGWRWVE
jgi:hypothetical protein